MGERAAQIVIVQELQDIVSLDSLMDKLGSLESNTRENTNFNPFVARCLPPHTFLPPSTPSANPL